MKRFALSALALAMLIATAAAFAQTPPAPSIVSTANFSWTAPAANTDGTPISGTLTYDLYQGTAAGGFTLLKSAITGTSADAIPIDLSKGDCFALTAVEGSLQSAPATTCAHQPAAPGGFTVTVTVTLH